MLCKGKRRGGCGSRRRALCHVMVWYEFFCFNLITSTFTLQHLLFRFMAKHSSDSKTACRYLYCSETASGSLSCKKCGFATNQSCVRSSKRYRFRARFEGIHCRSERDLKHKAPWSKSITAFILANVLTDNRRGMPGASMVGTAMWIV